MRKPPTATCFRYTAHASVAIIVVIALIACLPCGARGADLCVNSRGARGCFATVQDAINAVTAPDTTIMVQKGSYTAVCLGPACAVATISAVASNDAVLVGLTLQCGNGRNPRVTLNASGLDHAIYVSGVNQVTIAGCVAEDAGREGILVENADNVHLINNDVENNDLAMARTVGKGTPACPSFLSPGGATLQCCPDAFKGGPGNFPEDNDDCGEAIHLRAVTNSVVEGNLVQDNIGGILLSDETGPNENNLVTNNSSIHNLKFGGDCGVTLASHLACATGSTDATGCILAPPVAGIFQANGVFHNAVIGNLLTNNGASGTGVFANPGIPPGGATKAYGNLITANVVKNNGEPGIAIHVHAANGNADNNVIQGNVISGNGGDSEAEGNSPPDTGIELLSNGNFPPFSPAAPINGTIISGNKVSGEDIDLWVGNTATDAAAFLNNLVGNGTVGVKNAGSGTVTATDNWWGCRQGPGSRGCASIAGTVISTPFLSRPAN